MKVLIDTNIILDILLEREPFLENAIKLLEKAEDRTVEAFITANSVTDIIYISRKTYDISEIKSALGNLFKIIRIIGLDENDIIEAFLLDFKDYEDALQSQCANKANLNYIVTRNEKDFRQSNVKAISIDKILGLI